jgi:DNA-binding NarL/FixJ family response regulator
MNFQTLLIFQFVADVALFLGFVLLLVLITREIRNRPPVIDQETASQFKKMLEESQAAAAELARTVEESRRSLKELALALDQKESRLKELLEKMDDRRIDLKSTLPAGSAPLDPRYREVLRMVREGLETEEISRLSGLTEGEVLLIAELYGAGKM